MASTLAEQNLGKAAAFTPEVAASKGLRASPEELKEVYAEAQAGRLEAAVETPFPLGIWADAEVSHVRSPEAMPGDVQWPQLLAGREVIQLSVNDLVEELGVILDMRAVIDGEPIFVYSLQVESPSGWRWPARTGAPMLAELSPARRAELEVGHVYHEVLYRLSADQRLAFLSELLSTAQRLTVSVRASGAKLPPRIAVDITRET